MGAVKKCPFLSKLPNHIKVLNHKMKTYKKTKIILWGKLSIRILDEFFYKYEFNIYNNLHFLYNI